MKRVVSVWLPDWPITRRFGSLRSTPPEGPFALVERNHRGLVIHAANRAARTLGVRLGQTHADARALCPGLETAAADPAEDARALERLALWCERWSPSVAVDRVGPRLEGLTLDVTGAAHLWGGEASLLVDIETRLRAAGVPSRAAIAATPGAAWALARFGAPGRVVPAEATRAALADLPVEALRLAEPTLVLLKRLGLRRIGALYALPRAALARRFQGAAKSGEAALQVVRRLDQALGDLSEATEALRPPPVYRVWRPFAEPILIVEGVEHRLPELVEALSAQLERDGQGARRLALTAFRVDGRTTGVEVGFSTPARDPKRLLRVLRDAGLERLDLGFGADALMLTAPTAEAISPEQLATEQEEVGGDFPALVDRLQAKLGGAAVRRPSPRESWVPERSEHLSPAGEREGPAAKRWEGEGLHRRGLTPSPSHAASQRGPLPLPIQGEVSMARPILLLDPPEPAGGVLSKLPDYPPGGFTWRSVRRRIVRAQGPERISPEWWREGLPPAGDGADRPALKVAREDVEHIARQATARQQGSRKVSNPGVCVPALPAATGLEGRRGADGVGLQLVEPDAAGAVPRGLTLDGYGRAANEKPNPSPPGEGGSPQRGGGGEPRKLTTAGRLDGSPPGASRHPPQEGRDWADEDEDPLPPLPRTRDYFLVEDDAGERFWLFRDGLYGRETATPTWWVHGVFA